MPNRLDQALGIHAQALSLYAKRSELLAANIAHADTPNYKARDFDFQKILQQSTTASSGGTRLAQTQARHLSGSPLAGNGTPEALYRVPQQASLDGNTVEMPTEQAEFARNAVQYQVSLAFLNGKIRSLLTAIRGD